MLEEGLSKTEPFPLKRTEKDNKKQRIKAGENQAAEDVRAASKLAGERQSRAECGRIVDLSLLSVTEKEKSLRPAKESAG